MITKKFVVEFDGSRFLRNAIELQAKVTTDHASHKVRLHFSKTIPGTLWIDGTRTYTPYQTACVTTLFSQARRDVELAIDAYLANHNYPARDNLIEGKVDVWMDLNASHRVDEFRIEHFE